jgi:hypothetical protein
MAPAPQSKPSSPGLPPRGARCAVGGIRARAERPGRRASRHRLYSAKPSLWEQDLTRLRDRLGEARPSSLTALNRCRVPPVSERPHGAAHPAEHWPARRADGRSPYR